ARRCRSSCTSWSILDEAHAATCSSAKPVRPHYRDGYGGVPYRRLSSCPFSPSSPIRPAVRRFSQSKGLIGKEGRVREPRKSAVVPTKSIPTAANMPIIGGHHVLALQSSPEGWQATSLLERCREHTHRRRARGAAARAVSG